MFSFRKSFVRVGAVACLALLYAASAHAQEKVQLRLNLKKGQAFEQVISVQQKVSQTIQKQKMDTTTKTRFRMRMEVLENSSDGNLRIKTIYKTVQMDLLMKGAGRTDFTMHYDSTKPGEKIEPAMHAFKALVGQSITSTVSPVGEVLKIEGWDKLANGMANSMKIPAAQRAQFLKSMQASMKSQTGQSMGLSSFADQAVAIGDSWTTESTQTASVPILLATTYTLRTRENGTAVMDVNSTIQNNEDADAMEFSGSKVKTNFSGTQTGVMRVSEATGLPQNFELNMRFSGQVVVADPANPKNSMTIPMYSKATFYGRMVAPPR